MSRSATQVWNDPTHCVPFHRGRVALHAILRSFGIGAGDEVMLPGFSCVAVPAAILFTGARPHFVDIDADTLNLDEAALARALERRPAAVLLQHAFGSPGIPEELLEPMRARGIRIIEDCAHATGASHRGVAVGEFGDAAFTSLQWSKTVSCGLGGIARMRDPDGASQLRDLARGYPEPGVVNTLTLMALNELRDALLRPSVYERARSLYQRLGRWGFVPGSSDAAELMSPQMPAGYRLRFASRRLGSLRDALDRVERTIAHRRRVAARYRGWLEEQGCWIQRLSPGAVSTHLRVPLLVASRESFLADAQKARLEIGDWFEAPLHPASSPASVFGYEAGSCPVSERRTSQMVNLPTHSQMDETEIQRVLGFLETHREQIVENSGVADGVQQHAFEALRE